MSEDTSVEMVELDIEAPSEDWCKMLKQQTGHDQIDDVIAEVLDIAASGARDARHADGVEMSIEIPQTTLDNYMDAMSIYEDVEDDPETVISYILKAAAHSAGGAPI